MSEEPKPSIFGLTPAAFLSILFMMTGIHLAKGETPWPSFAELIALAAIVALAWWLITSRRKPRSGEGKGERIARHAGKLLKRVFRRLRGSSASTDKLT